MAFICGLAVGSAPVFAAESMRQDTVVDKIGDWFATIGKSGMEKDATLAQRKAARVAKRAEEAVRKQGRQAERQLNEAANELKTGFEN